MKRKTLLIALVYVLAVGCLVVVMAKDPGGEPTRKGEDNVPNARIPIDDGNQCQANCCGTSGGQVESNEQEGTVCHINEDNPNHDVQVAMFESCAAACNH